MTQTIKASGLADYQRRYWPLFIDDNMPQDGGDGPAYFARKVNAISDHFGDRHQLTVQFQDGTGDRVFDPDDEVVVHFIIRGTDLTTP